MRIEQIGDATLYLGDCMDILPTLNKVDAVVTDPPYGINYDYNSYKDTPENLIVIIEKVIPKIIKMSTRTAITCGNTNIQKYPNADWVACWTWYTSSSCGKLGWSNWQPILFYGEDVSKGTKNWDGKYKTDVIRYSARPDEIQKDQSFGHSCSKPTGFMKEMVFRFSIKGETILDPFMGSGTTGVAALDLGRKFIGVEKDPKYFDIACRRIDDSLRQGKLF